MEEQKVISFLENLLTGLKDKSLTEEQAKRVSEFYLSYEFLDTITEDDISNRDIINFLSLGWYIYSNFNK